MKTNEFLQAHIPPHVRHAHSLCCSCSPFMSSLTDQVIPYLPSRTSYRSWLSPCRPPYDSSNSQANRESSVSCLAPPCTANTVSSENDIDHGAVDRPSGVVAPRTYTSTSLARQSFIAWRIHVQCTCYFGLVQWPCHRQGASPSHEHQLPEPIRQPAMDSGVFSHCTSGYANLILIEISTCIFS